MDASGLKEGRGLLYTGDFFQEGIFHENALTEDDGITILSLGEGLYSSYRGPRKGHLPHGKQGRLFFKQLYDYSGGFQEGLKHGPGIEVNIKEGLIMEGHWQEGKK